MIYYLVTPHHAYTMAQFLASWGREFAGRIRVVHYFTPFRIGSHASVIIFSDLDRLGRIDPPSPQRQHAIELHRQLLLRVEPARLLNDPARSLGRYALLQALRDRGINSFRAWRPATDDPPACFPVLLRSESGSARKDMPLIRDLAAWRDAVAHIENREESLAIEFCDTADAPGVYRKYSAFIVGGRVIPRHVFFSRHWMVKDPDIVTPETLREELAYLETNPHEPFLKQIFDLARIRYGRIDYSLLDGRPQVWEINTNPMIASVVSSAVPQRRPVHTRFIEMLRAALDEIDPETDGQGQ